MIYYKINYSKVVFIMFVIAHIFYDENSFPIKVYYSKFKYRI